LRGEFFRGFLDPAYALGGIESRFDTLGEFYLLFGVEQRDFADLLEIRAYRIG
jgi:hypothetical protein